MPEKRPRTQMKRTASITGGLDLASAAAAASRSLRRKVEDFAQTAASFLNACSLCKRRLFPGRDIYMYRGDSAYCSEECREQQIRQDERIEKCLLIAPKSKAAATTATTPATGSEAVATTSETIAAL
ncbi:unnamed protein product [Cuscuta campestris]|uniref:FLZ-type domain-containing protein n=2 Tax=Cuscuta sect. Cleistogrammica TaxID=1824901 RepID=A0A484MD76_9ASTE|nr:hypothetical protein DM860_006740 [Cuscuta australis]VFQ86722.1 unnamed protein product [Cuscuta campestris]